MRIFQENDPVLEGGQGRGADGMTTDAAAVTVAVVAGMVAVIAAFFN